MSVRLRQPVYLQDIDFATAGGVATAADVLVKQARNRVRINRLKEGQAKASKRRQISISRLMGRTGNSRTQRGDAY